MVIQTMENNEAILQALHGMFGVNDRVFVAFYPRDDASFRDICFLMQTRHDSFLAEFKSLSNGEKFLTQDLEDMLLYIAKTGRVL